MSDVLMVSESEFRAARADMSRIIGVLAAGACEVLLSAAVASRLYRAFGALEHSVLNLHDVVANRDELLAKAEQKIEQLQRRLRDSKAECEQLRIAGAKEGEGPSEAQFLEGRDLVATLLLALGTKGDRKVAVAASHVQAIARSLRYLAAQRDQARAERDEARAEAVRLGKANEMNFRRADTLSVQVARQKESIGDLGRDLEAARAENGRLRGQLQAVKNFCTLDLGEQVF